MTMTETPRERHQEWERRQENLLWGILRISRKYCVEFEISHIVRTPHSHARCTICTLTHVVALQWNCIKTHLSGATKKKHEFVMWLALNSKWLLIIISLNSFVIVFNNENSSTKCVIQFDLATVDYLTLSFFVAWTMTVADNTMLSFFF